MVKETTKLNIKLGFSLAEALVSMLVLSMFFIATSKVITVKQPADKIYTLHGFYECYLDEGTLKEQTHGITAGGVRTVANCSYKPLQKLPNVVIYKIEEDKYYQSVETWTDKKITFSSNDISENGTDSYIYSLMNSPLEIENTTFLKNQLSVTYPTSEVGKKLSNNEQLHALFIAW